MDQARDGAKLPGLGDQGAHGFARRDIDARRSGLESCVEERLGGGVRLFLLEARQQHMLARADAPGDGLADLSCSDDDDDFIHDGSLGLMGRL